MKLMTTKYRQQVKDSMATSLVVGTILIFVNHIEAIASLLFTTADLLYWLLNYIIPFLVSLYSRISALKKLERRVKAIDA